MSHITAPAIALLAATACLHAQQAVSIDLTNVRIQHGLNQARSSAPSTIDPAERYHYSIEGMVRGQGGILGTMFPSATPLAQVMETLSPGSSENLSGFVDNCPGTHPAGISDEVLSGSTELLGINVNYGMTLSTGIDAADIAFFSLKNVTLSPSFLVGSLIFDSGQAEITRVYTCYANCDGSSIEPVLNVDDFTCFINKFANGDPYANCDCSTVEPVLNVDDFTCFINRFAAGCPPK